MAMGLAHAIAEEQDQLRAVLTDMRRQKKGSAERPSQFDKTINQGLQGSQRRPDPDLGQSSQDTATRPSHPKQQCPASDAPDVDGPADVSASHQSTAAATHLTDSPEGARAPSAASSHAAGSHKSSGHGSDVAADVSVPAQPTAVSVLCASAVSEHVSDVSAPVHFTDNSEATTATAGEVIVQEEAVTVIAAGDVDPQSTAASVALTSLQLAQTEGTQASSQGRPGLPSQGGGAGATAAIASASAGADVSTPASASGTPWTEDIQPQQTAADAILQQRVASHERLAARSADLMSRVDEQVLAGAQMDPEKLSGQKLGDTISQLLGSYQELKPSAAQAGPEASTGMEPEAHAAPQPTLPHEKTTPSYASLLQIRQRLAGQASQDSEECMDTAVVRAWLQANMPGLELLPATRVDVAQAAVLEETLEWCKEAEQQASISTGVAVEATLAEAMAHAEQCLKLLVSAKETPDLKALDALEIAKQLHASLAAIGGADVSPEEKVAAARQEGEASKEPMGKRVLAGVSRVSATLVAASLLITAWNVFVDYQRSVHWPPPV